MTNKPTNIAQGQPQRASLLQVIRAVSLGMLGFHKNPNFREELSKISVGQAFLGGFIAVIIFMTFVIFLVVLAIRHFS